MRRNLILRGALPAMLAMPLTTAAADIKIEWDEPTTFSDFAWEGGFSESHLELFKKGLRATVEAEVNDLLSANDSITLTFHDVDLAGEYEPWRTNFMDTRIMRDIYPPRLKFTYKVTDADDEVLTQGQAQLTDQTYLWNIPRTNWRSDEFYHEKQLLEDWASQKLPDLIKNGEGTDGSYASTES